MDVHYALYCRGERVVSSGANVVVADIDQGGGAVTAGTITGETAGHGVFVEVDVTDDASFATGETLAVDGGYLSR